MPQWYFRITDYADELLEMDDIDWPEKIKLMSELEPDFKAAVEASQEAV